MRNGYAAGRIIFAAAALVCWNTAQTSAAATPLLVSGVVYGTVLSVDVGGRRLNVLADSGETYRVDASHAGIQVNGQDAPWSQLTRGARVETLASSLDAAGKTVDAAQVWILNAGSYPKHRSLLKATALFRGVVTRTAFGPRRLALKLADGAVYSVIAEHAVIFLNGRMSHFARLGVGSPAIVYASKHSETSAFATEIQAWEEPILGNVTVQGTITNRDLASKSLSVKTREGTTYHINAAHVLIFIKGKRGTLDGLAADQSVRVHLYRLVGGQAWADWMQVFQK